MLKFSLARNAGRVRVRVSEFAPGSRMRGNDGFVFFARHPFLHVRSGQTLRLGFLSFVILVVRNSPPPLNFRA